MVEGQAAVVHFYQEAMMEPTGLSAVPNYRTRVTQAFVKEEGDWKIRAAHYSPLMGGQPPHKPSLNSSAEINVRLNF